MEKDKMAIDKFNGNLGNVNNFLFGKKVEKEETKKAAPKENVPVGQTQAAAETAKTDKTNLNLDANAIWGLHLTAQAKKVDTSDKAVEATASQFFKTEPDIYALKKEAGIPAEIEGIDDDIAEFLSPETLSFLAKVPPEQAERISNGTVNEFDRMIALA